MDKIVVNCESKKKIEKQIIKYPFHNLWLTYVMLFELSADSGNIIRGNRDDYLSLYKKINKQ